MKNTLLNRLLSPNLWVGVFSALAIVGIICISIGYKKVGLCLIAPLLLGGCVIVVFIIPFLIWENRKHPNR